MATTPPPSWAEKTFDAIAAFPGWLESFDALNIPGWVVLAVLGIAAIAFVFSIRELLSWFLKTNAITDEVIRLESLVRDLQGDIAALETVVARLQGTVAPADEVAAPPTQKPVEKSYETPASKKGFPLHH